MPVRELPDLSPEQVVRLQDELLANADRLLTAAVTLLDAWNAGLARSLAILGLEESGKAIAVHERRIEMGWAPEGAIFRCQRLDETWTSHQKKLEAVHRFLLDEQYWFGGPPDREVTAAILGTITRWSARHDRQKQRGFYVDLDKRGDPISPATAGDVDEVRTVLERVHQIGWQIRLGEHIEGKIQNERERDTPPLTADDLAWLDETTIDADIVADMKKRLLTGTHGNALHNAAYRFTRLDATPDPNPFRNVGKPGYEAESRQLLALWETLERDQPHLDL